MEKELGLLQVEGWSFLPLASCGGDYSSFDLSCPAAVFRAMWHRFCDEVHDAEMESLPCKSPDSGLGRVISLFQASLSSSEKWG